MITLLFILVHFEAHLLCQLQCNATCVHANLFLASPLLNFYPGLLFAWDWSYAGYLTSVSTVAQRQASCGHFHQIHLHMPKVPMAAICSQRYPDCHIQNCVPKDAVQAFLSVQCKWCACPSNLLECSSIRIHHLAAQHSVGRNGADSDSQQALAAFRLKILLHHSKQK